MQRLALWTCLTAAISGTAAAQKAADNVAMSLAGLEAIQAAATQAGTPEAVLARIRIHIHALLNKPQPELFAKHLRSVLALCEEDVLKLPFVAPPNPGLAKELLGYLKAIETGTGLTISPS